MECVQQLLLLWRGNERPHGCCCCVAPLVPDFGAGFILFPKALRISAEHVLELLHGLVRRRSAAGRIDAVRGMFVGGVWVFASVSVRDLPNLRA